MLPFEVFIIATFGIGAVIITGIDGDVSIDYHAVPKVIAYNKNYVYRAHYSPKNYDDAKSDCEDNNGHLVTIADELTTALVEDGLFDVDLLDSGNDGFFWIGLRWENKSWSFDGHNPSSWQGPASYSNWDDDPTPDEDHKECVGLKFYPRGDFKWHRENCGAMKAPYVCMELNTKCLPMIKKADGSEEQMQTSKNNYGCPNYRSGMKAIENNCVCNKTHEIRHTPGGRVCDDEEHVTNNTVCIPGCNNVPLAPVPDNAKLLDRGQVYHEGSRVAYYCPGVFEYNGVVHPHNLIELPCRGDEDFSKSVFHLLCHAHVDSSVTIKNLKTIHASLYYNYKLQCNHKGSPGLSKALGYIWYHGLREIKVGTTVGVTEYKVGDQTNNGQLEIINLSEEATGIYYCIAKYGKSYLPGIPYNITTEHHEATSAAISEWNKNDIMFLGHFYDPNNKTYYNHVAYLEPKTFDQARNSCIDHGGRLALVAGIDSHMVLSNLFSPESDRDNYQFKERVEDYPDRFWSGMALLLHHHYEWMDVSGVKLNDTLPWRAQDEGKKHEGQCASIKLHLTESRTNANDKISLISTNCATKLPFVCTYPTTQCLPSSVPKSGSVETENFKCSSQTDHLVKVKADSCECESGNTRINPAGHQSCTKKEVWNTALCVPECQPNSEYGAIVYPDKKYYSGMYMTYFCPGHFEVNGIEYNHNSLALKCSPAREGIVNLQCRREKLLSENALVTVKTLNLKKITDSKKPFKLECTEADPWQGSTIWMMKNELNLEDWKADRLKSVNNNDSLLTGPFFFKGSPSNTLMIEEADESIRGVYGCYFDIDADKKGKNVAKGLGILVPGNVYKIAFEGDDEESAEDKPTASKSSYPTTWQQTGIYIHHIAMLLFLLVLIS